MQRKLLLRVKRDEMRFAAACATWTTPAAEKIICKWAFWCIDYHIIVDMIKIDWIAKLLAEKERSAAWEEREQEVEEKQGKQGEQEARERNPCWLPFRRKISCLFMRPMSYLLHKGQSVHLFKVSVFPLSSPPCNKCRGYVIIGPRRITGLADCDDCIKACGTFVSSSAHLQMSSWSET